MATTTINNGDVYITDGTINADRTTITTSGNQKVIHIIPTQKVDYNMDNQITFVSMPIPAGSRGATPFALALDLKRIKEVITITGYLADENRSDGVSNSAESKRDDIMYLCKFSGELTVVYGRKHTTSDYQTIWKKPESGDNQNERGGFILKASFTSTPGQLGGTVGEASNEEPNDRNISVIVTLVRGKDMV